jgi:hypothetical protein
MAGIQDTFRRPYQPHFSIERPFFDVWEVSFFDVILGSHTMPSDKVGFFFLVNPIGLDITLYVTHQFVR